MAGVAFSFQVYEDAMIDLTRLPDINFQQLANQVMCLHQDLPVLACWDKLAKRPFEGS